MMHRSIARFVLLVAAITFVSTADAGWFRNSPTGTWLLTVEFPAGGPPPFKEFLVFHAGGTLTETNTTLHANSADIVTSPLPLNGSMGSGAWRRIGRHTVKFTFIKFVFGVDGEHDGYLRVSGKAKISGDHLEGRASTELLMGPDLDNPHAVIPFGTAPSTGKRIRP